MLAAALEAEVEAYLAAHVEARDEAGRRLVVTAVSSSGVQVQAVGSLR